MADNNKKNNNFLLIIVLALIFGLAAGIVGELFSRAYLSNGAFSIPILSEINLSSGDYRGQNIIIRDPKKVVVEEEDKVQEIFNSANDSIVGIFKKQIAPNAETINLDNFYQPSDRLGEGLIITSDGWIISSFSFGERPDINNYVIITKKKKVYPIEKIIKDKISSFSFIRVKAKDFSVKKFAALADIRAGQTVLAFGWEGKIRKSTIVNLRKADDSLISSSENFMGAIDLIDQSSTDYQDAILFNLAGDVVGLADQAGLIRPIFNFNSATLSLLKTENIRRASLGVYYVDLSSLIKIPTSAEKENSGEQNNNSLEEGALIVKNQKGVAVVKGGSAEQAGLREGDLIVAVNNIKLDKNNDLADLISQYTVGDSIIVSYLRSNVRKEVEIKLGELK